MLPGVEITARPLHFFWIVDCSSSMDGEKIESLNAAILEAVPEMRRVAQDNPNAKVLVRAVKFSNGAQWHIHQPTPIEDFQWKDVSAAGVTDMGKAFMLIAEQLKTPPMEARGLPPVLVLLSDGQPTDDTNRGLKAIMASEWGSKAVRLAIAIGRDADKDMLQKFIGHPEITPLEANNSEQLTQFIKWASTVAVQAASAPNIQVNRQQAGGDTLTSLPPLPLPTNSGGSGDDIW